MDIGTDARQFSGRFVVPARPNLQEVPGQKMLETNYSYGFEKDEEKLKRNDGDFRKWSNPLEVRSVLWTEFPSMA